LTKPLSDYQKLQDQIKAIQDQYNKLAASVDPIGANIGNPAARSIDPLEKVKTSLQQIYETMQKIKAIGPIKPIGDNNLQSNASGGTGFSPTLGDNQPPLSFANEGGFVGGIPGRDVNLIAANRDEYIMNSEATRQFKPILDMMNSSKIYNNSLQIGDVNVNSNSGDGSQIGQDLISFLKRAARQGHLRLGQ
jgi:hypothetical protein